MHNTQLVKHNFVGQMPVYELQAKSDYTGLWVAMKTSSRLSDIQNFCIKYPDYPMPEKIIECNNHK
jgi:hypothetical protein